MMKLNFRYLIILIPALIISCARVGTPPGGDKDIISPKVLVTNLENNSINVPTDIKEIKIKFDEYIVLNNIYANLMVSPSMDIPPQITPQSGASKYITIKFREALKPNTTYMFNFGNSIQDNNEGNKFQYFTFVFSTGSIIDNRGLSGKIVSVLNTKPSSDMVAALYTKDSIKSKTPKPVYVVKPDENGGFKFTNIKDRKDYVLYAFNNKNGALNPFSVEEGDVGKYEDEVDFEKNSLYTIKTFPAPVKYSFTEAKKEDAGKIKFSFKGSNVDMEIKSISPILKEKTQIDNQKGDAYAYFSSVFLKDSYNSLKFLVKDNKSGKSDTVTINYAKDRNLPELAVSPLTKQINPTDKFGIITTTPIEKINKSFITVSNEGNDVPFIIEKENNKAIIDFPIEYDAKYRIRLGEGAIEDVFGNTNKKGIVYSITAKGTKDYGSLDLAIKNDIKYNYQILVKTPKGELVRKIMKSKGEKKTLFKDLLPGNYNLEVFIDYNGDGKWNSGNIEQGEKSEPIYTKEIQIRAYWTVSEDWTLE